MFASTCLIILVLWCCTNESNGFQLDRPRLQGPSVASLKEIVVFTCEIKNQLTNETILLRLFKKDDREEILGEYSLPPDEEIGVFPREIKDYYEGYLECEASIQNNTEINATVSQGHFFRVFEPVRGAEILHEGPTEIFEGDKLELQCKAAAGSNVYYKFFLNKYSITKHRQGMNDSWLIIPRVSSKDGGTYSCMALNQFNDTIFHSNSSGIVITIKESVEGAKIVYTGPTEIFEGNYLDLQCKVEPGKHVSYKWFLNDRLITASPFHLIGDNRLRISRVSSKDSGSYMCQAIYVLNETMMSTFNSPEVLITIKDLVSALDISFTVVKEDDHNYSAIVSCESARGDPPIIFSLYHGEELIGTVNQSVRNVTFKIPAVIDQHSGWLQCQANNGGQTTYSLWLPFEIVPVSGPVMIDSDHIMAENYAIIGLILYCKVARGTHPRFQWYHNQTLLQDQGSFYYVVHQPPEQSLLVMSVDTRSSGMYRCKVWDSFDDTKFISSKRLYVDKEVLNHLPIAVVAVVLSCFVLLILLVMFCCISGIMFTRKQYQSKLNASLKMDRISVVSVSEDDLNLAEYGEDPDVGRAPREHAFYQESESSEEEWSLHEEERRTLEF
ncbi:Fc receptor-like protein 5 [Cyprinodon tularosa]|uniref:Fc receptor-like protein 5 n=1 Tax=Cyprinodon tularosa TaxID=77115 RepID=UPI0018E1EB60|nr:Fc receptor-like protein 5 [Cyprinodon tularosa]